MQGLVHSCCHNSPGVQMVCMPQYGHHMLAAICPGHCRHVKLLLLNCNAICPDAWGMLTWLANLQQLLAAACSSCGRLQHRKETQQAAVYPFYLPPQAIVRSVPNVIVPNRCVQQGEVISKHQSHATCVQAWAQGMLWWLHPAWFCCCSCYYCCFGCCCVGCWGWPVLEPYWQSCCQQHSCYCKQQHEDSEPAFLPHSTAAASC